MTGLYIRGPVLGAIYIISVHNNLSLGKYIYLLEQV